MAITKVEARTTRIDCPNCAKTAESDIQALPGIESARVDLLNAKVLYTFDPKVVNPTELKSKIEALGHFKFVDETGNRPSKLPFSRNLAWLLGIAILLYGIGALLAFGLQSELPGRIVFSIATLVGGWDILRRAFLAVRHRRLDINALMALAIGGAIVIGDLHEAVVVVLLFSLANLIESYSLWRLSRSLIQLSDFTSHLALRKSGDKIERVEPESLHVGDTIILKEGMRVPADATIITGSSFVDCSTLTGESQPRSVAVGDQIWAGTINLDGYLESRVNSCVEDSRIGKILRLVGEAGARKARIEKFVDRFARIYTPIVVAAAVLVAILPPLTVAASWTEWLYRALVFLVISCPCALVLSTPIAVTMALAAASRMQAILKGGDTLEQLATIRTIAFDKTGTLTTGALTLDRIESVGEISQDDSLLLAASLEAVSQHPVAKAISAEAKSRGLPLLDVVGGRAIPGVGVIGTIAGRSYELKAALPASMPPDSVGRAVVLTCEGSPIATFHLQDELRPESAGVISELHDHGVRSIGIISGDAPQAAKRLADELRLDFAEGGLLPDQKEHEIRRRAPGVAMVGDGVNDIVALAGADVAIAVSRFGNDIPAQYADIVLFGGNLKALPGLLRLGKRTLGTIKANIVFAFVVKLIFLALAFLGYADLWMAVVADMGASLLVIANSLRLLHSPLQHPVAS